ncbi:MAG TPA: sulfatase-like hydrolase/transferase, partial [Pirellulales bacterium]
ESEWRPFFLWLHTKSLAPPWDAPLSFRRPFVEDDDERLPDVCDFADFTLAKNFDPDERLIYQRSYAAQMTAFDACLTPLMDVIREAPADRPTIFVLIGARGIALGERQRIGLWDAYLHEEIVHAPLIIRGAPGDTAARRCLTLASSLDLPATLLDLYGLPATTLARTGRSLLPLARGEAESIRERMLLVGDREYAIRTPAWHLQQPRAMLETVEENPSKPFDMDDARGCRLFAKPDDRWEVNDVAGRARHVVEKLLPLAADMRSALRTGDLDPPPLDESLRTLEG